MKLNEVLAAGRVVRYHAAPVDRKQTVAEHTWGVLAILYEITDPSPALIEAAIFHDIAEVYTGDVPAPVKKASKQVKQIFDDLEEDALAEMEVSLPKLTREEQRYLKIADCLEGLHYCNSRIQAGDLGAVPVRDRYIVYLHKMGWKHEC